MGRHATTEQFLIRRAQPGDVSRIADIFAAAYGGNYPYHEFFDEAWLSRAVFDDRNVMFVALNEAGVAMGTASVVTDIGAHSDLIGEFGRLAVHPDGRGLGLGHALMEARIAAVEDRLHVALVENRTAHAGSQTISSVHGFAPIGLLPEKHQFTDRRESVVLYARHFGSALALRANHPHVVPEVQPLAALSSEALGLGCDVIVDAGAPPYPASDGFAFETMTSTGLPALLRIERGRIARREIFGPVSIHHGLFKLQAQAANYLIARRAGSDSVAGAIGFAIDPIEHGARIFELIAGNDDVVRPLLTAALALADAEETVYVELDVGADAPRMQRTLIELGFLPAAYVPAGAFDRVERVDTVRMVRLRSSAPNPSDLVLLAEATTVAETVLRPLREREVFPRVARALDQLRLVRGLADEQRARVASLCSVRHVSPGAALFAQGDAADAMYIVLEGMLEVAVDGAAVGQVSPGESVGEVSLLTREPRSASVAAPTGAVVAALTASDVAALTRQRPDIAVVVYRNLAIGLGRKLQRSNPRLVRSGQTARVQADELGS